MNKLTFKSKEDVEVSVEVGATEQTLLDIALSNEIDVLTLCGGVGSCKKCLVCVEQGSQYLQDIKNKQSIDPNAPCYACQTMFGSGQDCQVIIKID